MIRTFAFALAISLVMTQTGFAEDNSHVPTCELALSKLVDLLESKGELSPDRQVDELPDKGANFSICSVESSTQGHDSPHSYRIARHSDNVTVFVLRTSVNSTALEIYGPYYSAYRK
jgi:hypothetical protein